MISLIVFQSNNEGRVSRCQVSFLLQAPFLPGPSGRNTSSVPLAEINYRLLHGQSVTYHNLNVQYQKLSF